MPVRPHFSESRVDITLRGTITIPPDHFIDDMDEFIEYPDEITVELLNSRNGFTYEIKIVDLRNATLQPSGKFEVSYQKPGYNDHISSTMTLPEGFQIVDIST